MRWLRRLFPLALAVLLIFVVVEPLIPEAIAEPEGKIRFMPNVIPELRIHFVEEFFRFQWVGNTFDLKLLVAYEDKLLSLRDFWEKDKQAIKWRELVNKATESMYEFGYVIEDIPQIIADKVDYLVWKVEGTSFSPSQIELEVIEDPELDYNITRFHLPDNLVLSYEDLWLYDFSVSHPDKTTTRIDGVKGKTAWNLDPIVFSGGVITITGYDTEGGAADHEEIYTQLGDATQFEKLGYNQYFSHGRIVIGDGENATWFVDTSVQVAFNSSIWAASNQYCYWVKGNSHLRFGTLVDASEKIGRNGVDVYAKMRQSEVGYLTGCGILYTADEDPNPEANLYSCHFTEDTDTYGLRVFLYGNSNVYDCIFDGKGKGIEVWIGTGSDADFFEVLFLKSSLICYRASPTVNRVNFYGVNRPIEFYLSYPANVSNVYGRGITPYTFDCHSITADHYVTDADFDKWAFDWTGGAANTAEVYRQYTFNLAVTYPNGTAVNGTSTGCRATIQHYGQAQTTDYNATLGADGTIPQQTLSMGFYNQTGGDTLYSYNPYNLRIWNLTGYQDINMNFTLSETTKWTQTLQPTTEGGIATGFIFGGILAFLIMTVLGLAYIGKK